MIGSHWRTFRLQEGRSGATLWIERNDANRQLFRPFRLRGAGRDWLGQRLQPIGWIPRKAALEMGRELMCWHPDADSILLPSPHWPIIGAS
jgi:hypothetical protein